MDVKEAIQKRRSIRKYQNKPLEKEILNELIEAARLAPSGNNAQPWSFRIITDKEEIERLRSENIFKQAFVYTAPALILCCADPSKYPASEFDKNLDDQNAMRAIRDLAIASQNLVLLATELGLGTCYIGWMDKKKMKELYSIPQNHVLPYVITVGYPDEEPSEHMKKTVEEILF